jgi:hypothetical protein
MSTSNNQTDQKKEDDQKRIAMQLNGVSGTLIINLNSLFLYIIMGHEFYLYY